MPQLTIQLVTWNSSTDLEWILPTLQTIPREQVIIRCIDNHSTDNSVALVRRYLPYADILLLPHNSGFSGGHNAGFSKCTTPFVMTLNPDVKINWEGIKKVLQAFNDSKVGAVQGKLLREGRHNKQYVIDSAGVVLTRSFNGIDRGAGQIDRGQYNKPDQISAVTGACGIYRMSALRQVAHAGSEFFDNDFFAYKEDVDLGWRLNRAGWKVMYEPVVVGTHIRKLRKEGLINWGKNLGDIYRRLKSKRTSYSLRNWIWMITKNASNEEYLKHSVFIILRASVLVGVGLVYWPLFKTWLEALQGVPKMRQKR